MEAYFEAKRLLFASPLTRARIANADDAVRPPAGARSSRHGHVRARRARADYRAVDVRQSFTGSRFTALTPDGEFDVRIAAAGALQRAQRARRLGRRARARRAGGDDRRPRCAAAGRVPGRFEPVDEGQPYRRARRLLAHARLARERAARRARAGRAPRDRRLRRAAATATAASGR